MQKVQYVGPIEELRGQTALMERREIREIDKLSPLCVTITDRWQSVVQWDWPEGQKFTPRGVPIDAPLECFGWHEVNPSDWKLCHEIGELQAI